MYVNPLICDDNTMIMMGTNIFQTFKVHPVTFPIHDNDTDQNIQTFQSNIINTINQ